GSGAFVVKNCDATSWHELLHYFGPFCTEFRKTTKRSRFNQIVQNAPKRQFRAQWGWIGCIRCKKFRRDITARTFALVRSFFTEFRKASKRSRMHPNSTKHTKTLVYGPMGSTGCV